MQYNDNRKVNIMCTTYSVHVRESFAMLKQNCWRSWHRSMTLCLWAIDWGCWGKGGIRYSLATPFGSYGPRHSSTVPQRLDSEKWCWSCRRGCRGQPTRPNAMPRLSLWALFRRTWSHRPETIFWNPRSGSPWWRLRSGLRRCVDANSRSRHLLAGLRRRRLHRRWFDEMLPTYNTKQAGRVLKYLYDGNG